MNIRGLKNNFLSWIAIGLCLSWWIYLFFSTQMLISADAVGYEYLGRLLMEEGWKNYFITGPNREPFYPWLISVSMTLAKNWNISYIPIQKIFQISIFLISQLLLFRLLQELKIRPIITACVLFYFGFSPAMVNSVFSLYSEIATYPFVLGIVIISFTLLKGLLTASGKKVLFLSLGLIAMFLGITFVKGIFELLCPLYLICLLILSAMICRKDKKKLKNLFLCFIFIFIIYESAVVSYKYANKYFNGQFAFTDRGTWALYGNTVRKMQPLTMRHLGAALSYVPGEGVCKKFFKKDECHFWSASNSDVYGINALIILSNSQEIRKDQYNSIFIKLSFQEVSKNLSQFILLTGIDSFRIFFWESTQISFVEYPPWLSRIHSSIWFKNCLRLLLGLGTIFSIIYAHFFLFKHRQEFLTHSDNGRYAQMVVLFFFLAVPFIGLYSLFYISTRFAFPIVPLYLTLIAIMLNNLICNVDKKIYKIINPNIKK